MIARAVNAAADVIHRAQVNGAQTAAGLAFALESAQMLVSPEAAHQAAEVEAERDALKARVAELESAAYGDATVRLFTPVEQIRHLHAAVAAQQSRADTLDRLCREKNARITELEGERHSTNTALVDATVAQRRAEGRPTGEAEPSAKCRCDEPGADPYSCEAEPEDCTGEFSELNPFGGGPVQGHDAKVSRTCACGWRTSVWHVADGSAEEELHGHVVRAHGGTAPVVKAGEPS